MSETKPQPHAVPSILSPWDEQARFIVGDRNLIGVDDKRLMRREVSFALAWAYEQGFAQGRLHEIDRERTVP